MLNTSIPRSWSALTWKQLCRMWHVKMHYVGNADVARAAALLALCDVKRVRKSKVADVRTGEHVYSLRDGSGTVFTVTARALAQMAKASLSWFDFPYGDPGEREEKDGDGKVVKPGRMGVDGYVSDMRDTLIIAEEHVTVRGKRFSLPQLACNNFTWQQYRSLQNIAMQLFTEGTGDNEALHAQAQFLAHSLVPRSLALLDTTGGSVRIRPHYEYRYNAEQAEGMVKFWERRLRKAAVSLLLDKRMTSHRTNAVVLFHICFQAYQTALSYYSQAYPLLFDDSGKHGTIRDALQGEVGTINTIMKYAGYAEQQQVYDSNLPFVLDILNTMSREAKEIEKMNSKAKMK